MTAFPCLTMRHVYALAAARGYQVSFNERSVRIVDRYFDRPERIIHLDAPFPVDPAAAKPWHFTCLYCWMLGYDLRLEEPATIRLERAATHPAFEATKQRAMQMEYTDLFQMQCEVADQVLRVDLSRTPDEHNRLQEHRVDLAVRKFSDQALTRRYLKERRRQQALLHFLRTKSPGRRPALPNTMMITRCKRELERRGLPLPSVPESCEQG